MPVHIELNEIRVFKAVFEENGFKKAADKLFVTQSAVSQTISNLELKLDTLLFERKPLKLTEAGIRVLNYAESMLREHDTVLADINNIKHGVLATLPLVMSSTTNEVFGEKLIEAFLEESPLTRLKLAILPSRQIISAIHSDLWELGFGPFQKVMPPQFQTRPLYTDERKLVIHKERADGKPDEVLTRIPLVVSHLDDPDMRPAIDKLRDAFGTIWEVNDLNLRMRLIRSGHAIGYLDSRYLNKVGMGQLRILDELPFSRIPLTFGLYHRKRKPLSTAAIKFMDVCRAFDFREYSGDS